VRALTEKDNARIADPLQKRIQIAAAFQTM
jgi:hypothetical protein